VVFQGFHCSQRGDVRTAGMDFSTDNTTPGSYYTCVGVEKKQKNKTLAFILGKLSPYKLLRAKLQKCPMSGGVLPRRDRC
jgi:hypothetical protein